jgi:hypothetical protein
MRSLTLGPEATSARRTCLKKNGSRYITSTRTGTAVGLLILPSAMIAAPCIAGLVGSKSSRKMLARVGTAWGLPRAPSERIA